MRIAVVFSAAHRRGGVERVAWESLRFFGQRHDMVFVGGEMERPGLTVEVEHVVVDATAATSPRAFRKAATAALGGVRADRVVSFGVNCPPGDVLSVGSVHRAWLGQGRPVPYRGRLIPAWARYAMPRHVSLLALERSYFRAGRTREVVAVSGSVADDLSALYGLDRERIHVVPNGFAPEDFSPARAAALRHEVRAQLGVAKDHCVVLFVGNELHRKGFGTLVGALAEVDDQRLHLHVVGKAPLDSYQPLISRLGLSQRVSWHGPTNDVGRFFAAADLFVLPTQYEPFGIVVIEALAMGVPVITTRLAGASAAVSPAVGLLQEDPDDVGELARLLEQALQPGVLERWRVHAPVAAAPYAWSRVLAELEGIVTA